MDSENHVFDTHEVTFDLSTLSDSDKEILYIEDTQRLLLLMPNYLNERKQALDRHQSFDFHFESIIDTALPDTIARMVQSGWRADAFVQFNVAAAQKQTSIGAHFVMTRTREIDNVEERVEIATNIDPSLESTSHIVTRLENNAQTEKSDIQIVDEQEIYRFIASIAAKDNENLAVKFLHHPEQFGHYLHNPFAFDSTFKLLRSQADQGYSQNLFSLDDPSTLPASLTITYNDASLLQVEAELWNDHEHNHSLGVHLVNEELMPPVESNTSSVGSIDFSFGDTPEPEERPLYNRPVSFEASGVDYQPPLQDLEEIHSRLTDIIQYLSIPVTKVPFDDERQHDAF